MCQIGYVGARDVIVMLTCIYLVKYAANAKYQTK